jgi:hypothetical protein
MCGAQDMVEQAHERQTAVRLSKMYQAMKTLFARTIAIVALLLSTGLLLFATGCGPV